MATLSAWLRQACAGHALAKKQRPTRNSATKDVDMKTTAHLVRTAALLGAACLVCSPARAHTGSAIAQQVIKWKASATSTAKQSRMSNVEARLGVTMTLQRVLATKGEVMGMNREHRSLVSAGPCLLAGAASAGLPVRVWF
jgi:hypothetical protein